MYLQLMGYQTLIAKKIERSSLLNECKFDAGDSIMADRGILVQDLFANQNMSINILTLLKGKGQL